MPFDLNLLDTYTSSIILFPKCDVCGARDCKIEHSHNEHALIQDVWPEEFFNIPQQYELAADERPRLPRRATLVDDISGDDRGLVYGNSDESE